MEGTAALRDAAARWSLAGDQQLLDLLQDIHQRIISKCNETNKRLEEMSRGLRDASVNLQNVNNKFLALSNTQFVESRVYEDDTDVATPAIEKEPSKIKDLASDLTKLKQSLQILESYHEPLLIVRDSDSDTDSDDNDDRLVLKPKDLYAERPLPYIIGSQAWRNKWHAGLVPDESDSDSSTSKAQDVEVYSDSEDEQPEPQDYAPARKISTGSSSLQSSAPPSPPQASPAAVAAELARRLGGNAQVPEREPLYTQPEPIVRKLYKPQAPQTTTIFPDEPPPLDEASSDDDIFAELHKTQPKAHSNRVDGLFDFSPEKNGLEEALFGPPKVQTSQTIDKPPLFMEQSEPEIETPKTTNKEQTDEGVKKPIGGISLFGTNKHAESIGAAILKRNRRKSSSSDDESNTEEVKIAKEKPVQEVKKERDIFDDLFAKSERLNKKTAKIEPVQPKEIVKPKEVKKDVFSNIFDDIDDIFSSDIVNVQIKETKKNEKSLFDDDDDLFAEIPKVKKEIEKDSRKAVSSEKSDLFPNVAPKPETSKEKPNFIADVKPQVDRSNVKRENKIIQEIKDTKGLFDSDSDDGLFTNVTKDLKQNINKTEKPVEYKLKDDLFDDDEDDGMFAKNNTVAKAKLVNNTNISKVPEISKNALFDSDEELFKDMKNAEEIKPQHSDQNTRSIENIKEYNNVTPTNKNEEEAEKPHINNEVRSERDVLSKTEEIRKGTTIAGSTNNDLFRDDFPPESSKKSVLESSHDSFEDEDPLVNKPTIINNYATETTVLNAVPIRQGSKSTESSDTMFDKQEPPYVRENILRTTRIGLDEENVPRASQVKDIVIDSDDDLFRSKPTMPKISKTDNQIDTTPKATIVPGSPELFSRPVDKNDIFSDIFDDVPPVFEKPKEPKKSKNVNALFDDDSDDEALFFKKNDVITDEKPEFSPSEERFGIFNDEPPAIDIDFTQKSNRYEEVKQNSLKTDDVIQTSDKTDNLTPKLLKTEDIVGNLDEKMVAVQSKEAEHDTTDNTSKEPKKVGKLKPMNFNINVNTLLPGASPKKKQVQTDTDGQSTSNEELNKTDKVESKMVKSISFDDPEILDNKISKERAKIQVKRRPSTRRARKEAVRKSAIDFTDSSFDSSNDNSVKDEVKQEKIVKTVYILNDDDIFGSTKTNNDTTEHTKKHLNIVDSDEELFKKPQNTDKNQSVNVTNNDANVHKDTVERKSSFDSVDSDDLFKKPSILTHMVKDEVDTTLFTDVQNESKTGFEENDNLFHSKNDDDAIGNSDNQEEFKKDTVKKSFVDSDDKDVLFKQTDIKPKADPIITPSIDSDEELFRNPPITKNYQKVQPRSFLNSDDEDNLFKTKNTETIKPVLKTNISSNEEGLFRNKGIGTLGKVYNKPDNNITKEPHNIFDDFPAKPTDNFNTNEITQAKPNTIKEPVVDKNYKVEKAVVKKSILDDLSDEDDLFTSKTKLMDKKEKSLFGDDGDDDDLFGSKPVKEVKQNAPAALPTKEPKATEPVFVDPLSLFGDDD